MLVLMLVLVLVLVVLVLVLGLSSVSGLVFFLALFVFGLFWC